MIPEDSDCDCLDKARKEAQDRIDGLRELFEARLRELQLRVDSLEVQNAKF